MLRLHRNISLSALWSAQTRMAISDSKDLLDIKKKRISKIVRTSVGGDTSMGKNLCESLLQNAGAWLAIAGFLKILVTVVSLQLYHDRWFLVNYKICNLGACDYLKDLRKCFSIKNRNWIAHILKRVISTSVVELQMAANHHNNLQKCISHSMDFIKVKI